MINDRQITISVGSSRRAVQWQPQVLRLSELYDRILTPARSPENMAAYLSLPKGQQYPVIAHHLVVQGGMDEDVVASLHDKGDTQEALMQALKARIEKARGR